MTPMTDEEIRAALGRIQDEIARQDAANERTVWRTPEELAALQAAARRTDALRLRWFALVVDYTWHRKAVGR